jgi:hypothetical protein
MNKKEYEPIYRGQEIIRGSQLFNKETRKWGYYWSKDHPYRPNIENRLFDPKEIRRPKKVETRPNEKI